jgi:co-chaperonin GroES (HSP10)
MPSALKKPTTGEPDPKQEILDRLGDLEHFEIAQNEVLIAIYRRPEKTAGGIILTHNSLKEDLYQGKVGLVVKIGSACQFVRTDAKTGITYGIPIALHDWVVVRPSDSWALDVNGDPNTLKREDFVPCRLVYDDQIRGKVANPQVVW